MSRCSADGAAAGPLRCTARLTAAASHRCKDNRRESPLHWCPIPPLCAAPPCLAGESRHAVRTRWLRARCAAHRPASDTLRCDAPDRCAAPDRMPDQNKAPASGGPARAATCLCRGAGRRVPTRLPDRNAASACSGRNCINLSKSRRRWMQGAHSSPLRVQLEGEHECG